MMRLNEHERSISGDIYSMRYRTGSPLARSRTARFGDRRARGRGSRYVYFVEEGGRAMRYGVGAGKEGFAWSGTAVIHDKQEWPDWYPPKEMIQRRPDFALSLASCEVASASLVGPSIRSG